MLALCTLLAVAAAPEPAVILAKVTEVLAPERCSSVLEMVTSRADGTQKTYRMRMYKLGDDVVRMDFVYPPVEEGRVMLRRGDDMWMMMRGIKRPLRIAAKDRLMNGDFDNSDVLRLNLVADYTPALGEESGEQYLLELTAKDRSVAYDRVLLWVTKADFMPTRAQYFTVSGKMTREIEYRDVRSFGGHRRPATLVARNVLAGGNASVMTTLEFVAGKTLAAAEFQLAAIGR